VKSRKSGTAWRHANVGRLLNNAVRRFEARVLELMSASGHVETRIAHVSLTRNLDVEGTRLTELAQRASMSKQAMGELVDQCAELGLVERMADPKDGRARIIRFTPTASSGSTPFVTPSMSPSGRCATNSASPRWTRF
jgi:DNA-binding MarR family transcriptional regulator